MQIKNSGGLQPTNNERTINGNGVIGDKGFGASDDKGRYVFFEMLSFNGFKRWMKAHKGDYRYTGMIESMLFIDSITATYRAAWSIYWNDADAAGAIRLLEGTESAQYAGQGA